MIIEYCTLNEGWMNGQRQFEAHEADWPVLHFHLIYIMAMHLSLVIHNGHAFIP